MPDAEEIDLLRRCQRRDEQAFRRLVERYQRRTYWIAHNMLNHYELAQDISQQAFLRVFRNIERFDVTKNFYTWLYQIVVNLCIDHLRRVSHARAASGGEDLGAIADARPGPSEQSGRSELRERIRRALDRLPPKYKAVLTLRDIQGFSCEEISEIAGCTNATVRWRLHRARKLFRTLWDGREVAAEGEEEAG